MTSPSSADLGDRLPHVRVTPPGPRSRELAARLARVECPAFGARRDTRFLESGVDQLPIVYAEARGANVVDADGNRYVDMTAGFGALPLGHGHPKVLAAVTAQMARLGHALGDVYSADVKVTLLERLALLHPGMSAAGPSARALLGLSGADAVTAALKTSQLATGRPGVVAFHGSYHGLSHGPLAACGLSEGFRAPFRQQLGVPVVFAPYPKDAGEVGEALRQVAHGLRSQAVGAVLVEPLLGRGGCVGPPPGFLAALRGACDEVGALLIVDEIWTGFGRAGSLLTSVAEGVVPDLLCVGKALGSGFPISACIGTAKVMEPWANHGGGALHTATHFGSPVACAAALATLDALADGVVIETAAARGDAFRAALQRALPSHPVTGRGLMVGVDLGSPSRALSAMRRLLGRGFLALTGGPLGNLLTLSPPLTIASPLLEAFVEALGDAMADALVDALASTASTPD